MRLRKIVFLLFSLVVLIALSGCSGASKGTSPSPTGNASQPTSVTQNGAPARSADLWGKVKTIRGNKISVFKVENSSEIITEEQKASQQAKMQALSPEERAKAREEKLKVTTETVDILIPVGTPIILTGTSTNGADNVDISQIKKDDLLKLWLEKPSDGSEASVEFVQINRGGSGQ